MPLSVGIVGMPNVGKSTLFNALTHAGAKVSNYPFSTIDKNVGVVEVPDKKLWRLNELLKPKECTPTTIQFIDIAGLVKGASKGEGLGNKFLGHIREVDAVIHVVRCFRDENVSHVNESVDPVRDIEVVNTELALSDLETAEKAISKMEKTVKTDPRHEGKEALEALIKIRDGLREGKTAKDVWLTAEEKELAKGYNLLTMKPMLYVANVDEADLGKETQGLKAIKEAVGEENVIAISVKIEEEISELPEDEQGAFLADLGLSEFGVTSVILAGYRLLNLITFYTIANDKLRAWQVVRGAKAPQAAGKIHSDMERGFIRAEVVSYQDLEKYKTMAELHHRGLVRVEGKDYEIRPDDVVHFLFSV